MISAAIIGLHYAFRDNYEVMHRISENVVTPIRNFQSKVTSYLPFSLAELLMAVVLVWILMRIIRRDWKELFSGLLTLGLVVWAGFSLLWGTYYYGEQGMKADPISVEQLYAVTEYFADMANRTYCDEPDRDRIVRKSKEMNQGIGVKKIYCSKVLSLLDFAGFFFPLTGEANVNIDMPAHDLAATCAHELGHLNGVSREQDANFYAVKTSLEFADQEYVYSAALLAYTHLGNALYEADHELWTKVYERLSDQVVADFRETNEYWKQYETPVQEVSNTVYDGFLQGYGQEQGIKSYGACVDLLVNYYYLETQK